MKTIVSPALLVRSVPYGESDIIATLLTETDGKLGAIVRGARKGSRRVGGALEPFHTIDVRLDDRGGELTALREARIVTVRAGLVASLEAIDAAGAALRWARHAWPARTPEPDAWRTLVALLDALDGAAADRRDPRIELAIAGLRLLADMGYALDLERCVRCGRPCPEDRKAQVDASRGGLLCARCGGAHVVLAPALRHLARAAQAGEPVALGADDARVLLGLVEDAMAAHAGYER